MVLSSVGTRARRGLPHADGLPDELWAPRHRTVVGVLWCALVGLVTFGLARGTSAAHLALEVAVIVLSGALATSGAAGRGTRTAAATFGVLACAAVLVHLWDGATEGHFAFFVVVPLLTLYQDWLPLGFAVVAVLAHHLVAGAIAPERVFDHQGAIDHPVGWAFLHAAFVLLTAVAAVSAWRASEHAGELAEAARRAQEESVARRRHALEVHDDVVQGLAVARLALDLDDDDSARRAIVGALEAARTVVGELLGDDVDAELTRTRATSPTMAPPGSLPGLGPALPAGRRGAAR